MIASGWTRCRASGDLTFSLLQFLFQPCYCLFMFFSPLGCKVESSKMSLMFLRLFIYRGGPGMHAAVVVLVDIARRQLD